MVPTTSEPDVIEKLVNEIFSPILLANSDTIEFFSFPMVIVCFEKRNYYQCLFIQYGCFLFFFVLILAPKHWLAASSNYVR